MEKVLLPWGLIFILSSLVLFKLIIFDTLYNMNFGQNGPLAQLKHWAVGTVILNSHGGFKQFSTAIVALNNS